MIISANEYSANGDNQMPVSNLKDNIFQERLKKREIWINGPIEQDIIEKLYINLIELNQQSADQPISVMVNSNGGLMYESMVATDIMTTLSNEVKTFGLANVQSGGFIIFMAGRVRIIHDNTRIMMHDAKNSFLMERVGQIGDTNKYVQKAIEKQAEFFSTQTGGRTTQGYWMDLFNNGKDVFFDSDEAIELGIAHKVIRRPKLADYGDQAYLWTLMGG